MSQLFSIQNDKIVIDKLELSKLEGSVHHTGQLNIVDVRVKDEHRERWPTKYAAFKANMEAPESGTPLDEWAGVGRSQVMELNSVHIRTVEQLAGLSDSQLAKAIPMGGNALRAKAQRFIEQTDAEKPLQAMEQRIRELEEKLALAVESKAERAIAIACLGDFTTLPPLPECNEPVLNSFITLPTFAILPFFVVGF